MENLNKLVLEIITKEGKKEQVTIAQVREIIGVMGQRWRDMKTHDVLREVASICEKAGTRVQKEEVEDDED